MSTDNIRIRIASTRSDADRLVDKKIRATATRSAASQRVNSRKASASRAMATSSAASCLRDINRYEQEAVRKGREYGEIKREVDPQPALMLAPLSKPNRVANKALCPCDSGLRVGRCHHKILNCQRRYAIRRWYLRHARAVLCYVNAPPLRLPKQPGALLSATWGECPLCYQSTLFRIAA